MIEVVNKSSQIEPPPSRAFCFDTASAFCIDYLQVYFELHNMHPTFDPTREAYIFYGEIPEDFAKSLNAREVSLTPISPVAK